MTGIATRTGSRLAFWILIALLLLASTAIPAAAHSGTANLGIDAVGITSVTRITLGRVALKGTVTCSKTTSGVNVWAGVRQVAGRTNTVSGENYRTIRCVAGTKVPFSMTITPEQGKFVGGNALAWAHAEKYVYWETDETWHDHYDSASTERVVKLTK